MKKSQKAKKLSIIIPTLGKKDSLNTTLSSITTSLDKDLEYEIIIVSKGQISLLKNTGDFIKTLNFQEDGIYKAMNFGIDQSCGEYLFFCGDDDIIFPMFKNLFLNGYKKNADLIIGNVFFGKNKIYKNSRYKFSILFKNICHQCIIYNKNFFVREVSSFTDMYHVQADHYANILCLAKNPKIYKKNICVAWYSNDGFSTKNLDNQFKKDFEKNIKIHFGTKYFLILYIKNFFLKILRRARY